MQFLRGFDHDELEESALGRFRCRPTTGNGNDDVLGTYVAISGCELLLQSPMDNLFDVSLVKNLMFAVGISIISNTFGDKSISGLVAMLPFPVIGRR